MSDLAKLKKALRKADAAGDTAAAKRLAAAIRTHLKTPTPPQTSIVEQGMSGVNEGIANIAGAPVDLAATALNAGSTAVRGVTGLDLGQIDDPFGGSESFKKLMAPTISDVDPQTTSQRYARSIGREAGEMAMPVMGAMGKASKPTEMITTALLSSLGSGTAGQVAEDVMPDQPVIRALAEMAGGGLGVGAKFSARKGPQAPSMDDLRNRQRDAYDYVDQSTSTITPRSRDSLVKDMQDRYASQGGDDLLNPKATRALTLMDDRLPQQPRIADVEKKRRFIGKNVAGAPDEGERSIGVGLKNEIDDYLENLKPGQDVTGADATEAVSALKEGREMTRRIKKAEMVTDGDVSAAEKAARRAATSGTGGNEVNAIRQNVNAILNNPRKRAGFSDDEIKAMEELVSGTPSINAMRLIGRLSPTSGALPMMGNLSAGAVGGLPALAPGFLGMTAKAAAEAATRKQVDDLSRLIRNGAVLPSKSMTDAERRVVEALLASQAATSLGP